MCIRDSGVPYYKSGKKIVEESKVQQIDVIDEVEINKNAINQSINGFEFELENGFEFDNLPTFSRNDNPSSFSREELDSKISDRELVFQRGINPYMPNNNYTNDVVARDIFLKPQNTTSEK